MMVTEKYNQRVELFSMRVGSTGVRKKPLIVRWDMTVLNKSHVVMDYGKELACGYLYKSR